jgi:hypothetical protein
MTVTRAGAAAALACELAKWAPLWRPLPFQGEPAWLQQRPTLANELLALPDERIEALDADPAALEQWTAARVPGIDALFRAAQACVDDAQPAAALAVAERCGRDVPGRKWQQLLHFAAATGAQAGARQLVEWCSGKAHLSRLLLQQHARCRIDGSVAVAHAVEWNGELCSAGRTLAARDGTAIQFHRADALAITATEAGLTPQAHALALHACGDLHIALLRKAAEAGVAAIDVAPCCYHLTRETRWQPLSQALAGCELVPLALTRDDLRLAVQETVTSGARAIRQQRELAAWRLGFDLLQREVRGIDGYLPTPSRPPRVLQEGFEAFCHDMAAHHGLTLPGSVDYANILAKGQHRLAEVRRLELPRHACRRALEILLVADRALWLAEQGYAVSVRTFCPRPLTPRNLLLQARLPQAVGRPQTPGPALEYPAWN